MGRTVLADEKLIATLCNISKTGGFVPGLIVGQCAIPNQKDYIVHLPTTPSSVQNQEELIGDGNPSVKTFEKLMDIDEITISEHARVVTRMLPGGMWVLGFFVVGPGDLFSDKNSLVKLRSIANKVHNCTKGNDFMNGKDPSNQKIILHFCSISKKYTCKTIEMDNLNSSIRPVDWKFKPYSTSWLQVDSVLDFDWLPPFFVIDHMGTKKRLLECLNKFKEHLDSLIYVINGNFCEPDQLLNTIEKPVKENNCDDNNEDNHYNLMFFEFMEPPKDDNVEGALVIEKSSELRFNGILTSRIFLHEKATAEDAVKAVKEDFVRSLASRLEMHWQTVEEPEAFDETSKYLLRSPPRRILFKPEDSDIAFSEYLFEGETEDEALLSITENLGFANCQIIVLEHDADPAEINNLEDDVDLAGSAEGTSHSSGRIKKQKSNSFLLYGITAACLTLLLSLLIHFLVS
ncbi:protein odr-4 homolog [Halyomorpha halys]|uniref:protein odr-4 homolog n=1 Tax=Halyomorpha halys TaxID=286706 RepID=UPI0006D4DDC7|nr:protein odr-4 homolog [Halyomorpha halys]